MNDKRKIWFNESYYLTNPQGEGIYYKDGSLVFNWRQLDAILCWMDFAEGLREGAADK